MTIWEQIKTRYDLASITAVADGLITAVIDWDGCHPNLLLFDLSNVLWEFCSDDDNHTLSP